MSSGLACKAGFDSVNCVLPLSEQSVPLSSPGLVQDPPEMSVSRSPPSLESATRLFNGSAVSVVRHLM
ncbi:hypothetical protein GB937_006703, partial [Aspergillus fischeri]